MKFLLALFLSTLAAFAQVTITGSFNTPDGHGINGKVVISLGRSTVTNTCATPVQVLAFKPVTVKITGGHLGALQLYASTCLTTSGVTQSWAVQDCTNTPTAILSVAQQPYIAFKQGSEIYISGVTGNAACNGVHIARGIHQQSTVPVNAGQQIILDVAGSGAWVSGGVMVYPDQTYTVQVYDSSNKLLYTGHWLVPNVGSADVTTLGQG